MDVRHRQLRDSGGADGAHVVSLVDGVASAHRVRAEMHKRHGVPIHGLDRHAPAQSRDRSREGDRAGGGRDDRDAAWRADVDPSMLPGVVGTALIEREQREDGPVDGPAPRPSSRGADQGGKSNQYDEQAHLRRPPPLSILQTSNHDSKGAVVLSIVLTASRGRGDSARHRSASRRRRPLAAARRLRQRAPPRRR
jgi:hypothetical protein